MAAFKMFGKTFLRVIGSKSSPTSRSLGGGSSYYDVVIIGGGVMGSSIAHWLASRAGKDLKIGVIEADPTYKTAATTLSVGGLRQQFSNPENIEIGLFARDFMRGLPQIMGGDLDNVPDVKFQPHGYLFLASEAGTDILEDNHRTQVSCGASTKLMTPGQLADLFPWLSVEGVALGCFGGDHEGSFDPWALLHVFKYKAIENGVDYISGEVVDVTGRDHLPSTVHVKTKNSSETIPLDFGKVVIASGGDSGHVGRLMGVGTGEGDMAVSIPVEKRKRYVYVPHCPTGPGLDCPLVIDPTGVYFRREGLGGNYLCGKSPSEDKEPEDTDLSVVDNDFFEDEVWPVLANRVQAFEQLKVRSSWAGNYDYNTWDQNGIVGKHPGLSNVFMACGFSGHGIQQGPAVGRAVAELILDGGYETIDLTRFGFERVIEKRKVLERNIV